MQRIEALKAHPDFKAYMALNKKMETGRKFCCHQMEHALDVARIYYLLCLEHYQDKPFNKFPDIRSERFKELIYAIGLLHDIGRWKQYQDQTLDHALEGAVLSKEILLDTGFSTKEIIMAFRAIRAHRNPSAKGLGGLLYQADKLSRNCRQCRAREQCYKINDMETVQKNYVRMRLNNLG